VHNDRRVLASELMSRATCNIQYSDDDADKNSPVSVVTGLWTG
jgi:hypothetical protein